MNLGLNGRMGRFPFYGLANVNGKVIKNLLGIGLVPTLTI